MKKTICLFLTLVIVMFSTITTFATGPKTKQQLINEFSQGVQTSNGVVRPEKEDVEAFENLFSKFELNSKQVNCISCFITDVNKEIVKVEPKSFDEMGFGLKMKVFKLSTRLAKDLVVNATRK